MTIASKGVAFVASAGVLVLGWQAGAARQLQLEAPEPPVPTAAEPATNPAGSSVPSPASGPSATTSVPGSPSVDATPSASRPTATATATARTIAGGTVTHKYGTVTVTVTITAGKITNVSARTTTVDSKSASITQSALPVLRSRVLAAGSASVNTVSGATYTSNAYLTSLQSALDKA